MLFIVFFVGLFLNFTAPNYFVQAFSIYMLSHCCIGVGIKWEQFITRRELEELVTSMQIDYAYRVKNWHNNVENVQRNDHG